ncbi:asparagine synthetase B family protein [Pedobacter arcticus]|uniref:asparagine synthetase B family protein n=1 Tax=Pedobacter arcticus TaxID=752140 RepID=UPI0002D97B16|nr:asparagine synthase-related protein [Pedobacter arcticus]
MSGFVGIITSKLEQFDIDILDIATSSMCQTCDDYSGSWRSEKADLRFAWLKTFDDTDDEHLPFTMDENIRIIGDVRLDNRIKLIGALKFIFGDEISNSTPDSYLVLYAYKQWGERCLDHISGDYAFAIWNEKEDYLFCARDHFGLVPFYYTQLNDKFLFTNFYTSLKDVPNLISELDDDVVKSYLSAGLNNYFDQTIYKDLKKLPPAHQLIYKNGVAHVSRYWDVPNQISPIRYKTTKEYVEHFYQLFEQSINDRTRNSKVASSLSGGMDSSAITAVTKKVLNECYGANHELKCFNIVYKYLVNEKEGFFGETIAKHLDIPINQYVAEDYLKKILKPLVSWLPEPIGVPHATPESQILSDVETFSRTYLTGFGGDPLFEYGESAKQKLKEQGYKVQSYKDEILFYRVFGRFSGTSLRHKLIGLIKSKPKKNFKKSINNHKYSLFKNVFSFSKKTENLDSLRTYFGMVKNPFWSSLFEMSYPGFNGYKVKVRQPFFSLDLFLFIIALPPHLLYKKSLLRMAMTPYLPTAVITRPKTLIFKNAHFENLQNHNIAEVLKNSISKKNKVFIGNADMKSLIEEATKSDTLANSDSDLLIIFTIMSWNNCVL